jgi:hypothetical protein
MSVSYVWQKWARSACFSTSWSSDLQAASGSSKPFEPLARDEDAIFRRSWESPQLLQANLPVRYSRSIWRSDQEPPRDRHGKPLPVPKDCFATYRYEIYLRTLDTPKRVARRGDSCWRLCFGNWQPQQHDNSGRKCWRLRLARVLRPRRTPKHHLRRPPQHRSNRQPPPARQNLRQSARQAKTTTPPAFSAGYPRWIASALSRQSRQRWPVCASVPLPNSASPVIAENVASLGIADRASRKQTGQRCRHCLFSGARKFNLRPLTPARPRIQRLCFWNLSVQIRPVICRRLAANAANGQRPCNPSVPIRPVFTLRWALGRSEAPNLQSVRPNSTHNLCEHCRALVEQGPPFSIFSLPGAEQNRMLTDRVPHTPAG